MSDREELERLRKEKRLRELEAKSGPSQGPIGAPEGVDFSAGEMVKNIPPSGMRYLNDMWQAVTSPKELVETLWNLGSDWVQSADPEYKAQHLEALQSALEHRYGGWDEVKRTAMEDPVGMLADLSGVMSATRVPSLVKWGKAIEPTTLVAKGMQKSIRGLPESMYASTAKFSTRRGMTPQRRQELVQTALKYGVTPTYKGINKLEKYIDSYNKQLNGLLDTAEKSGQQIPITRIQQRLKSLRDKKRSEFGFDNATDADFIDDVLVEMDEMATNQGRTTLTPKEVQRFKVDAYKKINFEARQAAQGNVPRNQLREDTLLAGALDAKDVLEEFDPAVRKVNADLGKLYDLRNQLEMPAARIANRDFMGMDFLIKPGAGGALGYAAGSPELGTTLGFMSSILGQPKVKAPMAIGLSKVANPTANVLGLLNDYIDPRARYGAALGGRMLEEEQ